MAARENITTLSRTSINISRWITPGWPDVVEI